MKKYFSTHKKSLKKSWTLLVMAIAFCFAGIGLLSSGLLTNKASALDNTYYVDPIGTDDVSHGTATGTDAFQTIQYAINDSRVVAGDTINVATGTYIESNIIISKGIAIEGTGATVADVVIVPAAEDGNADNAFASSAQNGFVIKSHNVTLRNLTIDGRGNPALTLGKNNFRAGIVTLDASQAGGGAWNNLHVDNVSIKYTYRRGISVFPRSVYGTIIENSNVEYVALNHAMYIGGQSQILNNTVKHVFQGIIVDPDATTTNTDLIKVNGNTLTEIGNFPGCWGYPNGQPRAIQPNPTGVARTFEVKNNTIDDIGSVGLSGTIGIYTRLADASSVIDNNNITLTSGTSWDTPGGSQSVGMLLGWSYANGFTVTNNHVNSSGYGMGIMAFGVGTIDKPMILEGNTLVGTSSTHTTQGDGTGIYIANQYLFASDKSESYVIIRNNNSISNFVRGIDVEKVITSTQPLTVIVNNNSIIGNTTQIDASTLSSSIDVINNWWGDTDLATIVSKISGNVTYAPFYVDSAMTTLSTIATVTASIIGTLGTDAITNIPFVTTLLDFEAGITTATGATFDVYDSDGTTPATALADTSIVIVKSADETVSKDYSIAILAETQVAPDDTGAVTVSSTNPQVLITDPDQPVTITIGDDTSNPTIDVSAFITDGTGTIPQITVTSSVADIVIPATTVTSTDDSWDGVIDAPTITTVSLPETSGETKTLGTAIEVGFADAKLSFDDAVKIVFPDQKGKRIGYTRTGISFTEITAECPANNGDALGVDEACKIDVDNDLVVWTRHFTKFATFSSAIIPAVVTIPSAKTTVASVSTSIPESIITPTVTAAPVTTERKLFDVILLTLDKTVLGDSSDLIARTEFTNFGTVPTLINLAYKIEDSDGNQVYAVEDEITVETENIITQEFADLNLSNGKYTLTLTTTYGDNVVDEFKRSFEIKSSSFVEENLTAILWAIGALVVCVIIAIGIYRIKKSNKR